MQRSSSSAGQPAHHSVRAASSSSGSRVSDQSGKVVRYPDYDSEDRILVCSYRCCWCCCFCSRFSRCSTIANYHSCVNQPCNACCRVLVASCARIGFLHCCFHDLAECTDLAGAAAHRFTPYRFHFLALLPAASPFSAAQYHADPCPGTGSGIVERS